MDPVQSLSNLCESHALRDSGLVLLPGICWLRIHAGFSLVGARAFSSLVVRACVPIGRFRLALSLIAACGKANSVALFDRFCILWDWPRFVQSRLIFWTWNKDICTELGAV